MVEAIGSIFMHIPFVDVLYIFVHIHISRCNCQMKLQLPIHFMMSNSSAMIVYLCVYMHLCYYLKGLFT